MRISKWLFGVCLMVTVVWGSGFSVNAEEAEIGTSVFGYKENEDGTITITYYAGTDETVVIPSEIDGKNVKSIGGEAFYECDTIKRVIVSAGITDIQDVQDCFTHYEGTFGRCKNLETVFLPSTLKTIGCNAFADCFKLREINLPEGLVTIGDYAFYNCESIEKLTIPDSVIQIGDRSFFLLNIDPLTYIPICGNPNAYAKTYADAHPNIKFICINHANIVTDAEIPAACWDSGETAGSHCADCGTILSGHKPIPRGHVCKWKITKEATVWAMGRKEYVCINCGKTEEHEWIPKLAAPKKGDVIPDSENNSYKVTKPGTRNGTVEFSSSKSSHSRIVIPRTVKIDGVIYKITSISKNAFKNNKNLKKITINGDITKINANAFSGCKNLKTIIIQSRKLKSVGKNAFKGINPKAKIKVPKDKLKAYKKLLNKKGQKSTVKITK